MATGKKKQKNEKIISVFWTKFLFVQWKYWCFFRSFFFFKPKKKKGTLSKKKITPYGTIVSSSSRRLLVLASIRRAFFFFFLFRSFFLSFLPFDFFLLQIFAVGRKGRGERRKEWRHGRVKKKKSTIVTWLILPVVICLSQRLSHACLSINNLYCETANGSLHQL